MSWFLFPIAPTVLMLAALGLERLESGLEYTLGGITDALLLHADTQPIAMAAATNPGNHRFPAPQGIDSV